MNKEQPVPHSRMEVIALIDMHQLRNLFVQTYHMPPEEYFFAKANEEPAIWVKITTELKIPVT